MPKLVGDYQLIARLGGGSMAELYVARKISQFGFVHRAVIKQVKRSRPDFRQLQRMLLDEARATACFDHPNLVSIFDVGETEQGLYLALEYVDGTDLRRVNQKLRARKEALPFELACYLVAEVLRGVHHAHTARGPDGQPLEIVHRDVNPSNVLVATSGHVKLADFGVVRMRERIQPKTEPGLVKGKYAYLAPEYIAGEPCSVQTDVYAAGIMLFELLSGRECFTGSTAYEVMWKIVNKGVPMYRLQREGVPEDLQRLVARATSMVPERRYASAQDMANALEAWLMRSQKHATPWVLSVFFNRHDLFQKPMDTPFQPLPTQGPGVSRDAHREPSGVRHPMSPASHGPSTDARGVVDDTLTPIPDLSGNVPLLGVHHPPQQQVAETRFINPRGATSPPLPGPDSAVGHGGDRTAAGHRTPDESAVATQPSMPHPAGWAGMPDANELVPSGHSAAPGAIPTVGPSDLGGAPAMQDVMTPLAQAPDGPYSPPSPPTPSWPHSIPPASSQGPYAAASAETTPYPSGGQPGGATPYPGGGQPGGATPYPSGGQPGGATPYPSGGQPGGATSYPGGGQPGGATPYPGGGQPGGATPYPSSGQPGGLASAGQPLGAPHPGAAPYGHQLDGTTPYPQAGAQPSGADPYGAQASGQAPDRASALGEASYDAQAGATAAAGSTELAPYASPPTNAAADLAAPVPYGSAPPAATGPGIDTSDLSTAMVTSGKLEETPAADVLDRLAVDNASGIIEFRCGLIWKRVLMSDGKPTGVTSNMGMELIGEHLVKARIISREDLEKALQNSERLDKPLTFCLLEQGALTREALEVELGRNLAARLQEVLEWRWGTYEFNAQTMAPVEILPKLDLNKLLNEARAHRQNQDSAPSAPGPTGIEDNTPQTKLKEALRVARSIAKSTGKGRVDRPWRNSKP